MNLRRILKCSDEENMLKEDADRSNVSIGAMVENIHFDIFRKLAIGILNINKYKRLVGEGKINQNQKHLWAKRTT